MDGRTHGGADWTDGHTDARVSVDGRRDGLDAGRNGCRDGLDGLDGRTDGCRDDRTGPAGPRLEEQARAAAQDAVEVGVRRDGGPQAEERGVQGGRRQLRKPRLRGELRAERARCGQRCGRSGAGITQLPQA